MKRQNITTLVLATAVFGISLSSCNKEQATDDLIGAKNEALSSLVDKSVQEDVDAATMNRSVQTNCNWQALLPDCAIVTESGEGYPMEIIIDYGDGCEDNFGRVKSGKVIITLSDEMMNAGAERTVTFEDFYVNNTHVEGIRTTVNLGENSEGYPQFSRELSMTLTKFSYTFVRNFSGVITWLSGYDTAECGDNVFELEGEGSCIRPNGVEITRVITEPLLIDRVCGYIIAGVVEVNAPMGTKTVDFGDGECDSLATVTGPDGETWEIDLNDFGPNGG